MDLRGLDTVMKDLFQSVVQGIASEIDNQKISASGDLKKSLRIETVNNADSYEILIKGNEYGLAVNLGRKPTVNPGTGEVKKKIRKWIDVKGINPTGKLNKDELAFLITRKIHKKGYAPKPFIKKSVEPFLNKIRDEAKTALKQEVKNSLNDKTD